MPWCFWHRAGVTRVSLGRVLWCHDASDIVQAWLMFLSVGFCDTLKLTGTSNGPEHPDSGLGIFQKQQDTAGDGEIRYLMKDSPEPAMYLMQPDNQTWVVGMSLYMKLYWNQKMVALLSRSPSPPCIWCNQTTRPGSSVSHCIWNCLGTRRWWRSYRDPRARHVSDAAR